MTKSVAPFASFERLKSLLGRVRGETQCVLAVKVPPRVPFEPRAIADLFKSMRIAIAVCANDLPKDLSIDIASGAVQGPARTLSQAHAFFKESENLLDVVAVGGINTGRDAYIAHLTGAKAVQVGSALMKEGAGALGRIDRELDSLLAEHGHKSVSEIVGKIRFSRMSIRAARPLAARLAPLLAALILSAFRRAHCARSYFQGFAPQRPRRLARPRTPAFHVGNTGSNPVGDAQFLDFTHDPPGLERDDMIDRTIDACGAL